MITGFNTDVRSGDKVFHVQTEDKGVKKPLIVSLIYQKGLILDSYRTPYETFLQSETFSEARLRQVLESQHRQIVMAIKEGKYQKGMPLEAYAEGDFVFKFPVPQEPAPLGNKPVETIPPKTEAKPQETGPNAPPTPEQPGQSISEKPLPHPPVVSPVAQPEIKGTDRPEIELTPELVAAEAKRASDSRELLDKLVASSLGMPAVEPLAQALPPSSPPKQPSVATAASSEPPVREMADKTAQVTPSVMDVNEAVKTGKIEKIEICLQSSREFVAGTAVDLRLFVQTRPGGIRLENVPIMIKVIGTNFVPRLYSGKTDKDGLMHIDFTLPEFNLGSAALLIQASTSVGGDQVKYLIRRK